MSDGGTVHTNRVDSDPVTAARTALAEHKQHCRTCDHGLPCKRRAELTAAWRQALRDAAASDRIPTTPPAV